MKLEKTARGFLRGEFYDGNGEKCSVQESSSAERPMLWLGIDDPKPLVLVTKEGWKEVDMPTGVLLTGRMHLTQENARELLPLLKKFIKQGCL